MGLKAASCALFLEKLGCSDGWDTRELPTQNKWQRDSSSSVCRILNVIQGSGEKERGRVCAVRDAI